MKNPKVLFYKLSYSLYQRLQKTIFRLVILGLINFTFKTSWSATTGYVIDSTLYSFVTLITTPTFVPPSIELLNKFMLSESHLFQEGEDSPQKKQITEDLELKEKVLSASQEVLNGAIRCLPNHSDSHRTLKNKLNQIAQELPSIKVYSLPNNFKYSISTQYRFGAINLPNKSILFNLKYPSWDDKFNKPFYFHEALEALSYEDRNYQLTGTLWTIYQNCEILLTIKNSASKIQEREMIKSIQQTSSQITRSEAVAVIINTLITKPLHYNEKLVPQNDKAYDSMIASGGGTTGIGSGGDPTAAYFIASLYSKALETIHDLDIWNKLINIKVEVFPGSTFFWACLKKFDLESILCKKDNLQNESDLQMKWATHLSNAYQVLKYKSEDSYTYFYQYFHLLSDTNNKEKGHIMVLDAQLLHWHYSNLKIPHEYISPERIILDKIVTD